MSEYLDRKVFHSDYEFLEQLDNQCYYPNVWDTEKFKGHTMALLRAALPIGYAAYMPMAGKTLRLMRFGIHSALRREGRGKKLLDYVLNATLCEQFSVILRESNDGGIEFLRNCGHPIIHSSLIRGEDEDAYYFKLRV